MNCSICKKSIKTTFLSKIVGTHVKDAKGRQHPICFECQKKFKTKKEIIEKLT